MSELSSLSVLITGAGRGIGLATARAFAQRGARLTIVARSQAEIREAAASLPGAPAHAAYAADVGDPEQCGQAVAHAVARFGGLSVLINAAGIHGAIGNFWTIEPEDWLNAVRINLQGTWAMMRYAVPHLARTRGSIINFAGGGDGPMSGFSAYGASKAAVIRFTETAAEELRPVGVRVNVIAPGAVNTRLLDRALAAGEERVGPHHYQALLRQRESGGVSAEHAAELCLFLASSRAESLTGKYLSAVWDDWRNWNDEEIQAIAGSTRLNLRRIK